MTTEKITYVLENESGYWGDASMLFRLKAKENDLHFIKAYATLSEANIDAFLKHYTVKSYEKHYDGDVVAVGEADDIYVMVSYGETGFKYNINVAGKTMAAVDDHIKELGKWLPPVVVKRGTRPISFWGFGDRGPFRSTRWLEVPGFDKIKHNYTASVTSKLSELIKSDLPESGGKLILFHGVPGTGKTYAIRSIISEWDENCVAHYILDPEQFFDKASYMNAVLLGDDNAYPTSVAAEDSTPPWKLIILEDAGELLAKDAKSRTGQGFARLLNITNGLIGQGLKILLLITTNEPIEAIHEAVAREGRCLANISFDALCPAEANRWLKTRASSVKVDESTTIADLYALTTKHRRITNLVPKQRAGFINDKPKMKRIKHAMKMVPPPSNSGRRVGKSGRNR